MTEKNCRKCAHVGVVEGGTMLVCRWEKTFLPPPVWRERLLGKNAPRTEESWAEGCPQYDVEYVRADALEAAQARIAELEQHIADMIDDSGRLKEARTALEGKG